MIEHLNPHEATCLGKAVSEIDVFFGRRRISGGVVVRENDGVWPP